jgi:hypothetical protein
VILLALGLILDWSIQKLGLNGDGKGEGIDIVLRWMYPKVCLQKMLFRRLEK